jgi:multidrug efflux pump subunit AcrA (membrane-fusion protein)
VVDANQIAQLRYITLGDISGENVEVLSGLQVGEKLVAAPADRELGGKQIAPRP